MPGYISEVLYMGDQYQDFIEIALPAGTDPSGYSLVHYNKNGAIKTTYDLNTLQGTMGGQDIYLFNDTTTTFQKISEPDALALVDDSGTVLQFISFGNTVTATTGPANGLTSTPVGTSGTTESLVTNDGGATYVASPSPTPGTIPCYGPGTLIDTPGGPRPVESLRPGDLVETLDNGPMPVVWLRRTDQVLHGLKPDARPVLIGAGAFGPGCPSRDLIVSPQHRILVGGAGQLDGRFAGQCLAPAKALTGLPGIRPAMGGSRITWHHFALPSHQIVRAEGCCTESLLPGPMVLNGLTGLQRRMLTCALDPARPGGAPARDCLSVGAVRRILCRAPARARRATARLDA